MTEQKDKIAHNMVNKSSYMNERAFDQEVCDDLAQKMKENTEELQQVEFNPNKEVVDYKGNLLQMYKEMNDPFNIEFVGERFDYEKNPADPTNPQQELEISPFKSSW